MPSRSTGAITQDWEPVVISRRRPKQADLRDPKAVSQAIRAGAQVETVRKFDAGSNKKSAAAQPVVYARKLDEQTEPAALDRVPAEVRTAIQKARVAKKMSQAELAKAINERVQVVQEYESGKAVPNQAVLALSPCISPNFIYFSIRPIVREKMAEAVIACHSVQEWTQQLEQANQSKKLVVVDFTASWCGPCRMMAPIFAELAKKFLDVVFLKVDVDELESVAKDWAVEAMPTFVFVKEGTIVDRVVGARKDELPKKIEQHK